MIRSIFQFFSAKRRLNYVLRKAAIGDAVEVLGVDRHLVAPPLVNLVGGDRVEVIFPSDDDLWLSDTAGTHTHGGVGAQ